MYSTCLPILKEDFNLKDQETFFLCVQAGNCKIVRKYLQKGMDINNKIENRLTALHLASLVGQYDVVKLLIESKANIHIRTSKGNTALHIACLSGFYKIAKLLIENKSKVNEQNSEIGATPLYLAVQANHPAIVKLLLDNGAIDYILTKCGYSPLEVGLQQKSFEAVSLLFIHRGAAFHHSVLCKNFLSMKNILDKSKETIINQPIINGITPLHVASYCNNIETIVFLICQGADTKAKSKHDQTASELAEELGYQDVLVFLRC